MPTTQRIRRKLAALAAVPLLVGLFVGCSAGGGESSKPAASGAEQTDQQAYEAWELKLNACMKEQGYDLPAPGADRGNGVDVGDEAVFKEAMTACTEKIGDPPGGTGEITQSDQEDMLKMMQCLRDKGYDVQDPKDGNITFPQGISAEDQKECGEALGGGGAVSVG
ncbi:hypothetical protein [Plantibacter sp. YIM 135249]|uniref:hypothetical protein n=1 Tax=Plantibacter sp. YIM 135249 TaxID=3423918 RepID=UPI003D34279E